MKNLLQPSDGSPEILGNSSVMVELSRLIEKVAPTDTTVLIEGESGTGKELVARAIHCKSKRAAAPFIAINCAALPENLMESELFGHERGAFTGAIAARKGEFEEAEGGTVFLDEVAELSFAMQGKLLRALQQREIRRVGRSGDIPVDIRLIAATSRDLRNSGFRSELYYRLSVIPVRMPALRDRPGDIPILVRHFIEKFQPRIGRPVSGISPAAEATLVRYHWPGNVRQLENAIQRALVLGSTDTLQFRDFPPDLFAEPEDAMTYDEALKEFKRELIGRTLARTGGDYRQTAILLDLYPTSIHKIMRNLGM